MSLDLNDATLLARGVPVIPHGSSVYSYHSVITRHHNPSTEFLMMSPGADVAVPMMTPLLLDETLPVGGRMALPEPHGFGVRLNPACPLHRPYPRAPNAN